MNTFLNKHIAAALVATTVLGTDRAAVAAPSAADTVPYRLQWTRDDNATDCISADQLADNLAQLLGGAGVASQQPSVILEGHVSRVPGLKDFQAKIRVLDAQGNLIGQRAISTSDADCSGLASSLLLVLAMSVNPNADLEQAPARIRSTPIETSALELKATTLTGNVHLSQGDFKLSVPDNSPIGRSAIVGGMTASHGIGPKPTLGIQLGTRHRISSELSALLAASVWMPRQVPIDALWVDANGVKVGASQLHTKGCYRVAQYSRLEFGTCAGIFLGLRWFSAPEFEKQQRTTKLFYGPSAGLEATVTLTPNWRLLGTVSLAAQFPHDRFNYLDPAQQSHRLYYPSWLAKDTLLGVEAQL